MKNESETDRLVRLVLGVIFIVAGYVLFTSGIAMIVAYILGAILIFTATTGYCHLYTMIRFTTTPDPESPSETPTDHH